MQCSPKKAWFGIAGLAVLAHVAMGPAWSQVTYAPVPAPADQMPPDPVPAVPREPPPAAVVAPPAADAPDVAPAAPPVTIEPAQPAPTDHGPGPADAAPTSETPGIATPAPPAPAKPAPAVEMPTPGKVGEVLKDVAKGDVKALRRGALLIHGNYCGIGNRPGKEPVDALDAACMRHDACTNEHSLPSCACDNRLRREAMTIAEDPATPADIKALATTMAASMVVLICK